MHPAVSTILFLLIGLLLFRAVAKVLTALLALRVIEAAKSCSCGYSMAGIPFGVCPECGKPHTLTALRPLGRPRRVLSLNLIAWTLCVSSGSWGVFWALSALFPPVETSRQSLTLNSTAGDIKFEWTIFEPRTNPNVEGLRVSVRETRSTAGIKPIIETITAKDLVPPTQTPDARAHIDELLSSIVDGAGELAPADRALLAGDLRWIIEGALKGTLSSALVPAGARAALYWGSGTGGWRRFTRRIEGWPFALIAALGWAGGTLLITQRWEARVKA